MSQWALLLGLTFFVRGLSAADDSPAGPAPSAGSSMEVVLVEGEHPGPALWKVAKRSRTLFILGTHAPLPKDLVWRSGEVESAIARANEVMGAYSVSLRVD